MVAPSAITPPSPPPPPPPPPAPPPAESIAFLHVHQPRPDQPLIVAVVSLLPSCSRPKNNVYQHKQLAERSAGLLLSIRRRPPAFALALANLCHRRLSFLQLQAQQQRWQFRKSGSSKEIKIFGGLSSSAAGTKTTQYIAPKHRGLHTLADGDRLGHIKRRSLCFSHSRQRFGCLICFLLKSRGPSSTLHSQCSPLSTACRSAPRRFCVAFSSTAVCK